MVQVMAQSTGKKLKLVSEEMAARVCEQIEGERRQSELLFAALKRLLDRHEPDWAACAEHRAVDSASATARSYAEGRSQER
jgi:hypothetical protein